MALKNPAEGRIVRLSRHHETAASAVDRVKTEFARELHDRVMQDLMAMLLQTQLFAREQKGDQGVLDQFAYIETSVRDVLNNIRQIEWDLRGQSGLGDEFISAVQSNLLALYRRRTGVKVHLSVSPTWPVTLPPDTSINLYRIIQEAITNAHRHGGARIVHVALKATSDHRIVVSIHDDGRGSAWFDDARPVGSGILGMRERAAMLGGELHIRSRRGGGGTTVVANFPKEVLNWRRKQAPSVS